MEHVKNVGAAILFLFFYSEKLYIIPKTALIISTKSVLFQKIIVSDIE